LINGPWQALLDEAKNHWQYALAAASAIRQMFPFQEWVKIAIVAVVTAVITSQVTLARLDERIKGLDERMKTYQAERDFIIRKRDEQIIELRHQVERIEAAVTLMQTERRRDAK